MRATFVLVAAVALATLFPAPSRADSKDDTSAKARFERLKKLAGEWTGKAGFDEGNEQSTSDATVTYRVTAAGSAVMETLFPGTSHEMVTMYHLNGDDLLLTHYCAAGNQPRMKAAPNDDSKKLVFKFIDGTNLDAAKDHHMHEATIEFVGDDHIKSVWVSYSDGKPMHTAKFDLKRKK